MVSVKARLLRTRIDDLCNESDLERERFLVVTFCKSQENECGNDYKCRFRSHTEEDTTGRPIVPNSLHLTIPIVTKSLCYFIRHKGNKKQCGRCCRVCP